MPIYEYYCSHCKKQYERLVMNDEQIKCAVCGTVLKKLISAPNFKIAGFNESNGYSCDGCKGGECESCK